MLAQVKEPNTGLLQSTIIWFFKILAVIGGLWRAEKSAAEKHIFAYLLSVILNNSCDKRQAGRWNHCALGSQY